MNGKIFIYLPLAFITGGLIGMWGPNEELQTLKTRQAQKELAAKPKGFDSFARMINIPDIAKRRRMHHSSTNRPKSNAERNITATPKTVKAKKPQKASNPEDLQERIAEAAELWQTRIELVRAGTLKSLSIGKDSEADFDAAMYKMNEEIRQSVQAIASALAAEEELTPELLVRLMGDVSTTMAQTYDNIGECVDDKFRDEVSKIQLIDFIDPSVAEPLIDVQDKLESNSIRRSAR
jgi:hypothetical protein